MIALESIRCWIFTTIGAAWVGWRGRSWDKETGEQVHGICYVHAAIVVTVAGVETIDRIGARDKEAGEKENRICHITTTISIDVAPQKL